MWRTRVLPLLAPALLAGAALAPAAAQTDEPAARGIWEPVSYPADIHLNGVFFVSPDVGWVTAGRHGQGGSLLHTRDGGTTWEMVLGDPASGEPLFERPTFVDENHGWILQRGRVGEWKVLRTTNGADWEQVGTLEAGWGLQHFQFLTPSVGIYLDGNNNISRIMRTTDGGRTWAEAFHGRACATLQVDGLTRTMDCPLEGMHFPTPLVGYAVAESRRVVYVARTEDGGRSWDVSVHSEMGDLGSYHEPTVYFVDERTGFLGLSDKTVHRTDDGGATWRGVIATVGGDIRFADPQVGWSFFSHKSLAFTTDGGRRWTSRDVPFPATVTAFSLPRRDRGYAVGEHGMVFRYRVVPASEPLAAGAIEGPAMPWFDAGIYERVSALDTAVGELRERAGLGAAAAPVAADGEESAVAEEMEFAAAGADDSGRAGEFDPACCAQELGALDLALAAVAAELPAFLEARKNLNLILSAARWAAVLPERLRELRSGLETFRDATGLAEAEVALDRIEASARALARATRQALGHELPAADEWSPVDAGLFPELTGNAPPADRLTKGSVR